MKCPKSIVGTPHTAHWHTVMAGSVTVAGGMCEGVFEPVAETVEVRQAQTRADYADLVAARYHQEAVDALQKAAFYRERARKIRAGFSVPTQWQVRDGDL